MRGLEIGWKGPRPDPSFATLFAPILPHLALYTWFYDPLDGMPFNPIALLDVDYERMCDDVDCERGILRPNTFFPRFVKYVREDWVEYYGVLRPIELKTFFDGMEQAFCKDRDRWENYQRRNETGWSLQKYGDAVIKAGGTFTNHYLAQVLDLCFFNVDGVYWEIYAKDNDILADVQTHVKLIDHLTCEERSLEQRLL